MCDCVHWCRVCSRVQWFWHFFRNSICFMCFWFGLEILRLVYKKVFFEILNGFYLIWPFILQKSNTAPYKSWKKISSKLVVQCIKRGGILCWFQKCAKVSSLAKGKKNLQKNWIFRDLENLAKNHFSEKKSLGTSWGESSTHFWNRREILFLLIPFAPNF